MDFVRIVAIVAGLIMGTSESETESKDESSTNNTETSTTRSSAELGLTTVEQQRM